MYTRVNLSPTRYYQSLRQKERLGHVLLVAFIIIMICVNSMFIHHQYKYPKRSFLDADSSQEYLLQHFPAYDTYPHLPTVTATGRGDGYSAFNHRERLAIASFPSSPLQTATTDGPTREASLLGSNSNNNNNEDTTLATTSSPKTITRPHAKEPFLAGGGRLKVLHTRLVNSRHSLVAETFRSRGHHLQLLQFDGAQPVSSIMGMSKAGEVLYNGVILLFSPSFTREMPQAGYQDFPTGDTLRDVFSEDGRRFLEDMLPLLEANVLQRYPYPVHIFHRGAMRQAVARRIKKILASASTVTIEDVAHVLEEDLSIASSLAEKCFTEVEEGLRKRQLPLPRRTSVPLSAAGEYDGGDAKPTEDVSFDDRVKWATREMRHSWQMNRFWANLVWQLPSLSSYEYYWRLDREAYLTKPSGQDVFASMAENHCAVGYHTLAYKTHKRAKEFWTTLENWRQTTLNRGGGGGDGEDTATAANMVISDNVFAAATRWLWDNRAQYNGKTFATHFVVGNMAIHRHPLYHSFMSFVDENEPLGLLRHDWDSDIISGVLEEIIMEREGWNVCEFSSFAGYKLGQDTI